MIMLGSMKDLKRGMYDEIWFIIRSIDWMSDRKIFDYPNVHHIPVLSPSEDLLFKYLSLKKNNRWNENSFENSYLPRFITEMANEPMVRQYLNLLWFKSRNGLKILLVCPCPDESLCHRSIIGGILMGTGADVHSTTNSQNIHLYVRYYHLYQHEIANFMEPISIPKSRQSGQAYRRVIDSNGNITFV